MSTGSSSSTESIYQDVEICAKHLMDVSFKYTWRIENYLQGIDKGTIIDSPPFEFNINLMKTKWSLAVRFWTDEDGSRLTNPVVICLNLVSSYCDTPEEVEVCYQFGVWNATVKQYEVCPTAKQQVELKSQSRSQELLSVGYRDVIILDRHLMKNTIQLFCKITLVKKHMEQNSLAMDLSSILKNSDLCDLVLVSSDGERFLVHKTIIGSRSPVLKKMIMSETNGEPVPVQMPASLLTSLLQYIYTDRVESLDSPQALLRIAYNFEMLGLKNFCEKALVDSINPTNVAGLLMIADTFECEKLKQAAKAYCEENSCSIVKTLAWKVMEHINPELFEEVCQRN